jgi:hypothetical protein
MKNLMTGLNTGSPTSILYSSRMKTTIVHDDGAIAIFGPNRLGTNGAIR